MSDTLNPQSSSLEKSSSLKTIAITVENLAPSQGTALSPLWFGFHDGSFASISQGSPAPMAVERLAEDGTTGFLTLEFSGSCQATPRSTRPGRPGRQAWASFSASSGSRSR